MMRVKGCPEALRTVGDHLRRRRLELGLEQADAARRSGVHRASIQNWERNVYQPAAAMRPKVITFLGYDPCG